MRSSVMILAVLLAGCGGGADTAGGEAASAHGILADPRGSSGTQQFVVIAAEPDWAQVEADARALCEGQTHCGVSGWSDAGQMASAMPMLDREAATMAFSYSLNRTTGFEQFLRDCKRWPGAADDACLASAEAES